MGVDNALGIRSGMELALQRFQFNVQLLEVADLTVVGPNYIASFVRHQDPLGNDVRHALEQTGQIADAHDPSHIPNP